jgi:hypothetical protein
MGWNGLDLVNEFSAELGDTSSGFKTKLLKWLNEGIKDIATAHEWPFLREKGKVVLLEGEDTHSLPLAKPDAPTVTAINGGSLTASSIYRVLITFYEGHSKVESIAGEISSEVTPSGSNLSLRLSDIPVSTCPLVTARRVYVSKGVSAFQYYGTISNNLEESSPGVPVTYDITADTSSQVTPPEEHSIFKLDGDLFIEGERKLDGTSVQNITFITQGVYPTGTPEIWAPVNEEEVMVYPKPSSDKTTSFHYFKIPAEIFGEKSSVPQIPSWLKPDLRRYVKWRGHDYRDRAGQESKEITYRENINFQKG